MAKIVELCPVTNGLPQETPAEATKAEAKAKAKNGKVEAVMKGKDKV